MLLTLLLFKLPGLDEPFTLNMLALLPFQLLGDNNQEQKSKAGRNSYSSFPISKVFSHLIPQLIFSATGTYAPEILVFLAQVSQYSFFCLPPTYVGGAVQKGFWTVLQGAQFSTHLKFPLFHMVSQASHFLYYI